MVRSLYGSSQPMQILRSTVHYVLALLIGAAHVRPAGWSPTQLRLLQGFPCGRNQSYGGSSETLNAV